MCCASAALPPFPNSNSLRPLYRARQMRLATSTILSSPAAKNSCFSLMLSATADRRLSIIQSKIGQQAHPSQGRTFGTQIQTRETNREDLKDREEALLRIYISHFPRLHGRSAVRPFCARRARKRRFWMGWRLCPPRFPARRTQKCRPKAAHAGIAAVISRIFAVFAVRSSSRCLITISEVLPPRGGARPG